MLSRVADSLYWLGRYLERVENYARFIDVNFNLSMDLPPGVSTQWEPLLAATGDIHQFRELYQDIDAASAICFLAFDERNPNSIFSSMQLARENARVVRESLTRETWEKINEAYHFMLEGKKQKIWKQNNPRSFFIDLRYAIQLLYGIAEDSVSRQTGWYYNQLGIFLERADKTSRILDVKYHILLPSVEQVGTPLDYLHWAALLKSVSGFETYRRNHGQFSSLGIVEFLVLDRYFPRSILFSLLQAQKCLHQVHGASAIGQFSNPAEKALGELVSELAYDDVEDLFNFGLHEYLDQLQIKVNKVSDEIYNTFFRVKPNFIATQEQ